MLTLQLRFFDWLIDSFTVSDFYSYTKGFVEDFFLLRKRKVC